MEITNRHWNELQAKIADISEKIDKLVDEASKELLTPADVCRMLKITRSTYQNYARDKLFEQIRIGENSRIYVRRSEIERLVKEGSI